MQGYLKDARIVGGRDLAERGVCNGRVGILELRIISDVESIAAEFEIHSFSNDEVLRDGEIEVGASGSAQTVAREGAVGIEGGGVDALSRATARALLKIDGSNQ